MKITTAVNKKLSWNWLNKFGPFLALLLVYGLFVTLNAKIATATALETIMQQSVIVGIAALGMTLVIITGGIDLSAGSNIAMSSVVIALLLDRLGMSPACAALGGVVSGLFWGLINGLLITRLRLVPFIVTLGSLLYVRGAAKGLANNMPITVGETWLSNLLAALPAGKRWLLFPSGAWLMLFLAALVYILLQYTRLGRHIFAVGSNELTARLCGIAVQRVKLFVFTMGGAFAGLAGVMLLSYQEQGDPTGAVGMELDIIAAVVIGGGSLSGGEGSIIGSLFGAIIMTVIRTGCQLNGWPTWVTQVVTGVVIVVAVAVDNLRHKKIK